MPLWLHTISFCIFWKYEHTMKRCPFFCIKVFGAFRLNLVFGSTLEFSRNRIHIDLIISKVTWIGDQTWLFELLNLYKTGIPIYLKAQHKFYLEYLSIWRIVTETRKNLISNFMHYNSVARLAFSLTKLTRTNTRWQTKNTCTPLSSRVDFSSLREVYHLMLVKYLTFQSGIT